MNDSSPAQVRQAIIDGHRKLADFLEAHPDLPVSEYISGGTYDYIGGDTEAVRFAELDRIAGVLGAPVTEVGMSYRMAELRFGPGVYYRVHAKQNRPADLAVVQQEQAA